MSRAYALFHASQERRKDGGKGEETNEPDKGDQKLAPKKNLACEIKLLLDSSMVLGKIMLEGLRSWLRIRGDDDLMYDWEKQYLVSPEEKRVVLQDTSDCPAFG